MPSLADECTKYLQGYEDPLNVFSILPSAEKYEENNLVDRCWEVIDKQTEEAVKSDGFGTIERSFILDEFFQSGQSMGDKGVRATRFNSRW